jgi:hypothetical protein
MVVRILPLKHSSTEFFLRSCVLVAIAITNKQPLSDSLMSAVKNESGKFFRKPADMSFQ